MSQREQYAHKKHFNALMGILVACLGIATYISLFTGALPENFAHTQPKVDHSKPPTTTETIVMQPELNFARQAEKIISVQSDNNESVHQVFSTEDEQTLIHVDVENKQVGKGTNRSSVMVTVN